MVLRNERLLLMPMLKKQLIAQVARDELREALSILEERLDTGARQYDSEDGTRPSRVKTTAATRVLRSASMKKTPRPQEHEIVDLNAEESVAEQVARLLAHQDCNAHSKEDDLPTTVEEARSPT